MITPKITGAKVQRLGRLLHMKYKVAELAEEIGVSPDAIYDSYLPAGAPFEKDRRGRILIVGTDFAAWVRKQYEDRKNKPKLKDDEVYCTHCRKVVNIEGMSILGVNARGVIQLVGRCSVCHGRVSRFSKRGVK